MGLSRRIADKYSAVVNERAFAVQATRGSIEVTAFSSLHRHSLDLSWLSSSAQPTHLNLVLPHFNHDQAFAGIKTACQVAFDLARRLELPLRILSLQDNLPAVARQRSLRSITGSFGALARGVTIVDRSELIGLEVGDGDLWLATFWTTAHALDVSASLGHIDRERVVYLVQDYEPGFDAWSTTYALARSTYHAGFRFIVNSTPLAHYLRKNEAVTIFDYQVFRPQVDVERAAAASEARRRSDEVRVFFYARPSRPRNLYALGAAAVQLGSRWSRANDKTSRLRVTTAGDRHPSIRLADGSVANQLGRLDWDEYFRVLANSDVVFSLQHSPHPSHPPLDGLASGAEVVTNELGGTRAAILPGARVVDTDVRELAGGISQAAEDARAKLRWQPDLRFLDRLGSPVGTVLDELSHSLERTLR